MQFYILSSLALACTCLCSVLPNNELLSRRPDSVADGVPLRILPFGDSITWGQGSSDGNGWRLELYNKLEPGNHVEYIGNVKSGKMENNRHEGHRGYDIDLIQHGDAKHLKGMPNLKLRPNVVLLMLGTNNIVRNVTYEAAPQLLGTLIEVLVDAYADAVILVGTIPPLRTPAWEKQRAQYNMALFGIVTKFAESGKHVSLVNMDAVKANHVSSEDKIHPTDAGYEILATKWYEGIKAAGRKGWLKAPVDLKAVVNQSGTKGSTNETVPATPSKEVVKGDQADDLVEEGKEKAKEHKDILDETKETENEQTKEEEKPQVLDEQPAGPVKPPTTDDDGRGSSVPGSPEAGSTEPESTTDSKKEAEVTDEETDPSLPKGDGAKQEDSATPKQEEAPKDTYNTALFESNRDGGSHTYLGIFTLFLVAFAVVFRRRIFSRLLR